MKNTSFHRGAAAAYSRLAGVFVSALVVLALSVTASTATASDELELDEDDAACMECHDNEDEPIADKQLEDGTKLPLRISTELYLASVHQDNNCTDCHFDLDEEEHGKVAAPMKNRRVIRESMQEACRDCHKKKFQEFDDSIHAFRLKEGSDEAPYCADCHNAHTQGAIRLAGSSIDQTPCANCHDAIFAAYAKDVHGLERVAQGKAAPICSDCHRAHDVKAASLDEGPRQACLSCHDAALAQHQDWLPNTGLHLDSISCVACHAPDAQRRLNLRLFDSATKSQLREKAGVPQFVRRVQASDTANVGLDERALWSLLTQFNQDGGLEGQAVLRGRLEVSSGLHAHQLSEKSTALKECKVCHEQGAEPFQSVVLSIAGPDGKPLRADVQADVLGKLPALKSVRGFYAIGSTRIRLLDTLLVLVVAGSIAGTLAHMAGKRMFRGLRERRAAEAQAAAAAAAAGAPADAAAGPSDRGPSSN
ncbi:MAG: hypothetical protein JSW68_05740 [Burkholderiales bacterium]|nr:MAG: hypothetical protein JSW68_05740 [Burkholderiales bacterium]